MLPQAHTHYLPIKSIIILFVVVLHLSIVFIISTIPDLKITIPQQKPITIEMVSFQPLTADEPQALKTDVVPQPTIDTDSHKPQAAKNTSQKPVKAVESTPKPSTVKKQTPDQKPKVDRQSILAKNNESLNSNLNNNVSTKEAPITPIQTPKAVEKTTETTLIQSQTSNDSSHTVNIPQPSTETQSNKATATEHKVAKPTNDTNVQPSATAEVKDSNQKDAHKPAQLASSNQQSSQNNTSKQNNASKNEASTASSSAKQAATKTTITNKNLVITMSSWKKKPDLQPSESLLKRLNVRNGTTLSIVLELKIDTKGKITDVTTKKSSGFTAYDEEMSKRVKTGILHPYLENGQPVSGTAILPISTNL